MAYEFYKTTPVTVLNSADPQLEPNIADSLVLTIKSPIELLEYIVEYITPENTTNDIALSATQYVKDIYNSLRYFGLAFRKLPKETLKLIADTLYGTDAIYEQIVTSVTEEDY